MRELLKSDLRRIVKDKLFLIACIIGAAMAVATPLLYKAILVIINLDPELLMGLLPLSGKNMFFNAFSTGNNFGLILPILVIIVICKDFSYGTVRNKIICGKSRVKVFFSMFFSSTIVICGLMLVHALLTLAVASCFFKYQAEEISLNTVLYALLSLLFSLLIYVFISAIVCLLSVLMKNSGIAVVIYVATVLFFTILGGVVSAAALVNAMFDKLPQKLFEILGRINIFNASYIGQGITYSATDVLCFLIPAIVGTALILTLGIFVFRKKDLK